MKYIFYLILLASITLNSFSQNNVRLPINDCYSDSIKLNTGGKDFRDTIVMVRNYINNNDEKRIICNNITVDEDIDKLIWECKYINTYLTYQNQMNKFSILYYKSDNQKNIIAYYFLCDRKSKEMVEMMRFKISNKKIAGINILPNLHNEFIPIEEFDNLEIPEGLKMTK